MNKFLTKKFGFSLVEVILAIALFGIFSTGLMSILFSSYGSGLQSDDRNVATLHAEEGLDAAMSIRRQAWNFLINGSHGLTDVSGYWEFSGNSELIDDKYTRVITVEDGCRDVSGDIVDCGDVGAAIDLNTKKITSSVTYTAITYVINQIDLVGYVTTWQTKDWDQTNWTGGSGQSEWSDISRYDSDDGNVDVSTTGQVVLATLGSTGCGTNTWSFDLAGSYTFDSGKIEIVSGVAQLLGSAGACSGAPNDCTTFAGQSSCEAQGGCAWGGGVGSCSNIVGGACSNVAGNQCNSTCAIANCSKSKGSCGGALDCTLVTDQALCGAGGCSQCEWTSGGGSCSGTATSCATYADSSSCGNQVGCSWAGGTYPSDDPTIEPNSTFPVSTISAWTSFTEDAIKDGGEVYYQISDGTNWYYYDSAVNNDWVFAGATDYNTAIEINANISTFPVASTEIKFRAFLASDGNQFVQLNSVSVSCSQNNSWTFDDGNNYTYDDTKIEVNAATALSMAQLKGPASGSKVWDFITAFNYTYDAGKITVDSNSAFLNGSASCSGTATLCSAYSDSSSCGGQDNCSWSASGSCADGPGASCSGLKGGDCNACGVASCVKSGGSCLGTITCPAVADQTTCESCGQCVWSVTGGSCSGTATACSAYSDSSSCGGQDTCSWSGTYATDDPPIKPTSTYAPSGFAGNWTSFTEVATKNGGEIYYKLYDGTSWYWYSSGWQTTGEGTLSEWNTAADINTNIGTFTTVSEEIMFTAFLSSNGNQAVTLNSVTINWSEGGGGGGGSCGNTATACSTYTDSPSCGGQDGCLWVLGGGSCANIVGGACSNVAGNQCNSTCAIANCSKSKGSCGGALDCTLITDSALCGFGGCSECEWTGGSDVCTDNPGATACTTYGDQISCEGQGGCVWTAGGGAGYPTTNPSIEPKTAYTVSNLGSWATFSEVATKNGGEIYYQISDGTTWYWWNGSSWVTAGATEYNIATDVHSNIESFPTASSQINFRAFLSSDGNQLVQLDTVAIGWVENGTCTGADLACEAYSDQVTCEADVVNSCVWNQGSGGGSYATLGVLTSSAFDTGTASAFDIIEWSESIPTCSPVCDVQVQVRTAPDSGGSPGTWTAWYGASGSGTYYSSPVETLLDTALNFNQWVQYRVELSGDGTDTPTFSDIKLNYLP